jgi:poly(A) polymerase/tRNA nucleotidyltransferase (CCA-adding enzyme)
MNSIEYSKRIPQYVFNVSDILKEHGYKSFLVGGAVRDILLNKTPKDYDIATDALPEQMEAIFQRCITTNARFGTVLVVMEDDTSERFDVEVTTFRKEENYYSGRWPAKVEFTSEIVEDLSRRDFTINAMAIDLAKLHDISTSNEEILIDPFNGMEDLENRIVRAVRDPLERFSEDGLRAYKACRLASELQFTLDVQTFEAIKKSLNVAKMISMERVRDEFNKMIYHSPKPSRGVNLMLKSGLLELFIPELIECIGIYQPEYHEDDVYIHSLKVLDKAEDTVKLAALFHDIGKARTKSVDENGRVHFYGHDQIGADMVKEIMTRLKYSNQEIKRVTNLIKHHMFYYPSAQWRKIKELNEIEDEETVNIGGWSDGAIRRFVKSVGEENIDDLFRLRIADATSNNKSQFDNKEIDALQKRISKIKEEDMVLKVTDLMIDGFDLIDIGFKPGPLIGKTLEKLLQKVMDEPNLNKKEELIKLAKELR